MKSQRALKLHPVTSSNRQHQRMDLRVTEPVCLSVAHQEPSRLPACHTAVSMCAENLKPSVHLPRATSSLRACSVSFVHCGHWQTPWRIPAVQSALSIALSGPELGPVSPFTQSLGVPWWVIVSVLSVSVPQPCLTVPADLGLPDSLSTSCLL